MFFQASEEYRETSTTHKTRRGRTVVEQHSSTSSSTYTKRTTSTSSKKQEQYNVIRLNGIPVPAVGTTNISCESSQGVVYFFFLTFYTIFKKFSTNIETVPHYTEFRGIPRTEARLALATHAAYRRYLVDRELPHARKFTLRSRVWLMHLALRDLEDACAITIKFKDNSPIAIPNILIVPFCLWLGAYVQRLTMGLATGAKRHDAYVSTSNSRD